MGMSNIQPDQMNQLGFDMQQQQAPTDTTAYAPEQMQGMPPDFASQYQDQYQQIPPELLQQLASQGIDPAMAMQGIDPSTMQQQQPMEQPDPVTSAMMLTFQAYEQTIQDQELNLDVRATTVKTFADALKVLSDIQNVGMEQQNQVPAELQFQMDMERMQMQMRAEQARIEMEQRRMEVELQYKVQEGQLKLELLREQASIKAEQESMRAQMDMDRKQDEHILNMAQKEDEANAQSTGPISGEDMS